MAHSMQIDALRPWTRVSQTFAQSVPVLFSSFCWLHDYYYYRRMCAKLSLEMYRVNINFDDDANFFVFLGILCFDLDDAVRRIIVEPDSIRFVDI